MLCPWTVVVILIAVNEQMVQALSCYKEDGREGTCKELKKCNVSLQVFDECKLLPEKCDSGFYRAEVCCPKRPWRNMERPIDYSCNTNLYSRRIIGVLVNDHTRYPHVAALGYLESHRKHYTWRCGGTLIHLRYVLTAAHCIDSSGPKVVLLGVSDLLQKDHPHAQMIEVESVIQHEEYQSNVYKDIALVYLKKAIRETVYVNPACLLTTDIISNGQVTTIGWGVGSEGSNRNLLKEAKLNVIQCRKRKEAELLKDLIVCAKGKTDAACAGDSGGPLQVFHNQRLYVMGVYNYGSRHCTSASYARFVRLTPFLDWIEKIVWKPERCVYDKSLPQ